MAKTDAVRCTLNESGDVGENDRFMVTGLDDAEIRERLAPLFEKFNWDEDVPPNPQSAPAQDKKELAHA